MSDTKENRKIARVDVRGKDMNLWQKLRPQLIARIEQVLAYELDGETKTTVREEAHALTQSVLEYARQRLQREGLENDRIEAEIASIYAEVRLKSSHADRASAIAEEQRRQTALKKLCEMLALTKAILLGEEGEEVVVFGKQIEDFLGAVKTLGLISP